MQSKRGCGTRKRNHDKDTQTKIMLQLQQQEKNPTDTLGGPMEKKFCICFRKTKQCFMFSILSNTTKKVGYKKK